MCSSPEDRWPLHQPQVLSRGSRTLSAGRSRQAPGQRTSRAPGGAAGAAAQEAKPRSSIQLEVVAVGIGLRFVELEGIQQVAALHVTYMFRLPKQSSR